MGAAYTKRRGKRYRYYVCNNAERNGYDACPVKSVPAGQIEGAVKERIHVIFRSPDMIARTFREVQAQVGQERVDLAGQKERLEARLADLKRTIGRLAQSDDHDGALAAELAKLNEEFAETRNQAEEVGHALEGMGAAGPTEDDVRDALQKLDPLWDELFPVEKERIVKLLVQEVVVSKDGLLIRLRLNGLNSLVAEVQGDGPVELGQDGQTVAIRVPMEFKVRGGRKEIILPAGAEAEPKAHPTQPMVLALARGHRWQRMLDAGSVPSVEAIAAQHGVDRTYVGRMLQLASLAPDIVQAILAGKEPSGISLSRLREGIPAMWEEQRRLCTRVGGR
jgi:site-specific DNA recombinase